MLFNLAAEEVDDRSKIAILCSLPGEKLTLILLTFCSVLFSSGTIFGWAPMLLILQQEGVFRDQCPDGNTVVNPDCDARDRQLNLIYTVGAFTSSIAGIFVGTFLDKFGPKITVLVGAIVNVGGFYFFGMIHSDLMIGGLSDEVSLMIGVMLLAIGGIFQFLSSFHIGFIVPEIQELVLGGCSCLFDASCCIFLFMNLIYENSAASMASIFIGFALLNGILHIALWIFWGKCAQYHPRNQVDIEPIEGTKDKLTADIFALNEPDESEYTPVCERDFWTQINPCLTPEFTYMLLFGVVNMTRSNLFLGLVADDLKQKGDDTKIYTKITSSIVPLGFLLVPFIDRTIRTWSLGTAMDITVVLGVTYGLTSLIPCLPVQLLTAVVYTMYRALLFSAIATFNAQTFGPASMGKVAGVMYTVSAPFQLLSYPLVAATQDWFNNNYDVANAFQVTWLIPVFVFSRWIRKNTREEQISGVSNQSPADTETSRVLSNYESGKVSYNAVKNDEFGL